MAKKNQKRLNNLYATISNVLYRDADLDMNPEQIQNAIHCFCYGIAKYLLSRDKEEIKKYRVSLKFKSSTCTNPHIYVSLGDTNEKKYNIAVYRDNQNIKYLNPDIPSLVYNYNKELETYIKDYAKKYYYFMFGYDVNDLMGCIFDVMLSYIEDKAFNKTSWKVKEEGVFKIKTKQIVDDLDKTHYECKFFIDQAVAE
jgi:hypothetical protein